MCKLEAHGELMRGYIAMLVVEDAFRGLGVGKCPNAYEAHCKLCTLSAEQQRCQMPGVIRLLHIEFR